MFYFPQIIDVPLIINKNVYNNIFSISKHKIRDHNTYGQKIKQIMYLVNCW